MGRWSTGRAAVVAAILAAGLSSGCTTGNAAPEPDVVAELQKLKLPTVPKTFTPALKAEVTAAWKGPGQFFVRNGCFSCHAVSVHGVKGLAPIGPDLSNAVEDVEARFGRKLEDFLEEPQGTMQMVFSQLIVLTPEQKAEAFQQLQNTYKEYLRQKAGTGSK